MQESFYNVGTIPVTGGSALDDVMWMRLHYRPYKFDYFTGANKSPLINQLNLFDSALNSGSELTKMTDWLSAASSDIRAAARNGADLPNLGANIPTNVKNTSDNTLYNITAHDLSVNYNTSALRARSNRQKFLIRKDSTKSRSIIIH